MPMVPAICEHCGEIFSSGMFIECPNATFNNVQVGPCPSCGQMGHIPDGLYSMLENTIELISGPMRSKSELEMIAKKLLGLRKKDLNDPQVKEEIVETLPELSSISGLLPKTRSELYAFIGIILTILNMLISSHSEKQPKIQADQVINQIYQDNRSYSNINIVMPPKNKLPKSDMRKPGRNAPCPCGSGLKYKKCHGRN